MKTRANSTWDRLAATLIANRDAWRRLIGLIREDPETKLLRRIRETAMAESERITAALKHPARGRG